MANSPTPIEIPKAAVLMVSPRDYRLSSLKGVVVNFKADLPVMVVPHVYEECLAIGAQLAEGETMPDAPPEKKPHESIVEAVKLEAEAKADALDKALRIVIARNDPNDFKADDTPKHPKVIAEMSPEIPRPTATEIADAFAALQDDLDLAED